MFIEEGRENKNTNNQAVKSKRLIIIIDECMLHQSTNQLNQNFQWSNPSETRLMQYSMQWQTFHPPGCQRGSSFLRPSDRWHPPWILTALSAKDTTVNEQTHCSTTTTTTTFETTGPSYRKKMKKYSNACTMVCFKISSVGNRDGYGYCFYTSMLISFRLTEQ